MPTEEEPLVTREILGLFVVFGADIIVLAVLLGLAGTIQRTDAVLVTGAILGVYGAWILLRWWRLRTPEPDPVETLKERYAAGELSEAEFERRLDRVIDTPVPGDESVDAGTREADAVDSPVEERGHGRERESRSERSR